MDKKTETNSKEHETINETSQLNENVKSNNEKHENGSPTPSPPPSPPPSRPPSPSQSPPSPSSRKASKTDDESIDTMFDKIMIKVGTNGKFQKRLNWIFNIVFVFFASVVFNNMFLGMGIPDHWCHVPGNTFTNYTQDEWKNVTIPRITDEYGVTSYDKCKMFNNPLIDNMSTDGVQNWNYSSDNVVACQFGHDYDKQWYERTAVSQENWVCENDLYRTNYFVFSRIGELIGALVFGPMGDTLGRQTIYYVSLIIVFVGRIASLISVSTYSLFVFFSGVAALTQNSLFQSPLVIAMEISTPEKTANIAMKQNLAWATGNCIMPLLLWVVRDWQIFIWLTTVPLVFFLFIPKYMIESPRWLASEGKFEKCSKTLQKIAKINGNPDVDVSETYLKKVLPPKVKKDSGYGIFSLFTHKRIALNTFLIIVCWCVSALTYFSMMMSVIELPGNPHINYFVQAILEYPSFFLGSYLCNKIGRRFTNASMFFLAMIMSFLLICIINFPAWDTYTMVITNLVKFFISVTFFAVYLQSMELYPTCLRQSGLSFGIFMANLFGMLGPYIVYMGNHWNKSYPYIFLTFAFGIATVTALFSPETLHVKLPETIEDAKHFGANQKFWFLPKPPVEEENVKEEMEILNPKKNHAP